MKFPYRRYAIIPSPTVPAGIVYRPEILIRAIGIIGHASFLALVDTGADETILPRSIGETIGAIIDERQHWPIGGIGGNDIDVVLGKVTFEIKTGRTKYTWSTHVGFASFAPQDEMAILGHIGFLDHFIAKFDTHRHELSLSRVK